MSTETPPEPVPPVEPTPSEPAAPEFPDETNIIKADLLELAKDPIFSELMGLMITARRMYGVAAGEMATFIASAQLGAGVTRRSPHSACLEASFGAAANQANQPFNQMELMSHLPRVFEWLKKLIEKNSAAEIAETQQQQAAAAAARKATAVPISVARPSWIPTELARNQMLALVGSPRDLPSVLDGVVAHAAEAPAPALPGSSFTILHLHTDRTSVTSRDNVYPLPPDAWQGSFRTNQRFQETIMRRFVKEMHRVPDLVVVDDLAALLPMTIIGDTGSAGGASPFRCHTAAQKLFKYFTGSDVAFVFGIPADDALPPVDISAVEWQSLAALTMLQAIRRDTVDLGPADAIDIRLIAVSATSR